MRIKKSHVLVVEDDDGDYELIAQAVYALPDLVVERFIRLGDLPEEKNGFKVAILDLNVPLTYGEETLNLFRKRFPHMPLIVLTGNEITSELEAMARDHAAILVEKGEIKPSGLMESIRAARRSAEEDAVGEDAHFLTVVARAMAFSEAAFTQEQFGIAILDENGDVIEINRRVATLLGYTSIPAMQQDGFNDRLHQGHRKEFWALWKELREGQTITRFVVETKLKKKDVDEYQDVVLGVERLVGDSSKLAGWYATMAVEKLGGTRNREVDQFNVIRTD